MAARGGEPRTWPYALIVALLCAGAIWGRSVEVAQRNSASNAAVSVDLELEPELIATMAEARGCLAAGRCDDLHSGFFGLGSADPASVGYERQMAGMTEFFWPDLGGYTSATLEWNAAMRAAVDEDLTVTDPAALQELVDGEQPQRLQRLLADARVALAERYARGRLLSQVFGWGWKLSLAAMFVLPIAVSVVRGRRHQRRLFALWREALGRQPAPLTPARSDDREA